MASNNLLTMASATGATVADDAEWISNAARLLGFQVGIVDPPLFNKALRQGAFGTSTLGQLVATYGLLDANDDGNVPGFLANIRVAIAAMMAGVYFAQDTSGVANTLTVQLDPAPPTLTTFRTLFIRAANTNTGPVAITVAGIGQKTATRHDGSPLQAGDIIVGRMYQFLYDQALGTFVLAGFGDAEIQRIANNVTFYVRTDGSDGNDGSANTSARAFATISAAIYAASTKYAASGAAITIQLGIAGTYAVPNPVPSFNGTIIIQGDANNIQNYIMSGAGPAGGGSGVLSLYSGTMMLNGLTLLNTGTTNNLINSQANGSIVCTNVAFTGTASNYAHVLAANGGSVTIGNGCQIRSNATAAFLADGGNIALQSGSAITLVNSPAFSIGFAVATNVGVIKTGSGVTFPGTAASGPRYYATTNGVVNGGGGGAGFFPGSTAGSTATGGQYA